MNTPVESAATQTLPAMPLPQPLGPGASTTVRYTVTTSNQVDGSSDICLCAAGVYPLDFTVSAAPSPDDTPTEAGFAQSYLPSFPTQPQPVQVSWLWPLIDQPHRTVDRTVFTDDALATSVRPGGRLYRALQVAMAVDTKTQLDLVIDPDLIDELATMTTGYRVQSANGSTRVGTGGSAAEAWLDDLQTVLPHCEVSLTAPADPDIDALTAAGLAWTSTPSTQATTILGSTSGVVAWPAGQTITPAALSQIARSAQAVVVDDRTLPGGAQAIPRPDALAELPGSVRAVVTDSVLQKYAAAALAPGGTRALPQLVADLAIRAGQDPQQPHYVVLAPDRTVDPNVALASRVIRETSGPAWARTMGIGQALQLVKPTDRGSLTPQSTATIGGLDQLHQISNFVAQFGSALRPVDRTSILGGLPAAIQRCESSAWRSDPDGGQACVNALQQTTGALSTAVSISQPSNGSYTMASSSAPLFLHLQNSLAVPVEVNVDVSTVNAVVGFRIDPIRTQTVPAHGKLDLRINAHVQRAGRFQLDATLTTPGGLAVGDMIRLNVRSTALGGIGVIITAVAGGVLVLALLVRLVRRLRARPAVSRPATPLATAAHP